MSEYSESLSSSDKARCMAKLEAVGWTAGDDGCRGGSVGLEKGEQDGENLKVFHSHNLYLLKRPPVKYGYIFYLLHCSPWCGTGRLYNYF